MIQKRPFGLILIAGFLACFGALLTVITVIQIFETTQFLGIQGISIISATSFAGFICYGLIPIFLYAAGVGLFMGRRWALMSCHRLVPVALFILILNMTANYTREAFHAYRASFMLLVWRHPQLFLTVGILSGLVLYILLLYLKSPLVLNFFQLSVEEEK
ncbi:MAG TPA: hypothetical protein VLJ10_03170 [Candidatus Bathyarchaeia archaeon]|nr:hypothetical protein [Candidatus Bathyarchaeia archaeon]